MNLFFIILVGAVIWGTLLYRLVNLTSYSNNIKGVIIILISAVAIYIVKIIDENLDHNKEE